MEHIFLPRQPAPKGHYSPAVVHGDTVYVSGQLPITNDGTIRNESIEAQVRQCLDNIREILKYSGSRLDLMLKVNIYVSSIEHWDEVNRVYAEIMGTHKPARLVVPVGKLHHNCDLEIDCIAAKA